MSALLQPGARLTAAMGEHALSASDEAARLEDLRSYNILDTEPEDMFDRFTRLASDLMGTPIAMISLLDEHRQWFKASIGLSNRETPRAHAFCDHAIRQVAPLVVPDASRDRRFTDNPLVRGHPRIRFYAGAPLRSAGGHAIGALCVIDTRPREISPDQVARLNDLAGATMTTLELRRLREQVERAGWTDALTGLEDRTRLLARLRARMAAHQVGDAPFSILSLGCEKLRQVNDTFGFDAGDLLLRSLARALFGWLRPADGLLARMSGDEFAAVLPGADEDAARRMGELLAANTAELMNRRDWPITLAVGAATFHHPPPSASDALALARSEMVRAKRGGPARVNIISDTLWAADLTKMPEAMLRQSLHDGIARHELFLQYQPIVPLREHGAALMEALVRWRHPVFGVVPPGQFIPAAERNGLIMPLGREVLSLALGQMRNWLDRGQAPAKVAVNVSGVQLAAADFAQGVLRALAASGVPPDRLDVELTEGVLIDCTETVLKNLHTLAGAGVSLTIDDFGTGYASLGALRNLPVHAIKIDRTFIKDIADNDRDTSIVAAIVAMARTLRLRTVAEGIETEAQRDRVRTLGCDHGQGWLFGRPS